MKVNKFEFQALYDWYYIFGRNHLPWRKHQPGNSHSKQNGYLVWLSEILLQQTQAERVVGYYERILEKYPNIEALAKTDYETFFPFYDGLGYYSRARNLLKCAQIVCERHQGIFPIETEELVKLPGIGPYTAEAIRSFTYGIPTLSFDTNLKKVFARYYFGSRFHPISKEMEILLLEDFITFTKETGISSADINAAFMDLGSIWCKNSKDTVDFSQSPFLHCLFTQTHGSLEIQEVRKKTYFPTPDAQIVVILHENHKKYYSENSEKYVPFILPPVSTAEGVVQDVKMNKEVVKMVPRIEDKEAVGEKIEKIKGMNGENEAKVSPEGKLEDTAKKLSIRDWVKKYFEDTYGLKVSVRPEHKKEYQDGIPHVFVRAQIQSGKMGFYEYKERNFEIRT